MMKLIKLQDKFIQVSDEDIEVNDYFLAGDSIEQCLSSSEIDDLSIGEQYPKVIAGIPTLPTVDFSLLSEKDCKTIGYIDIEELAQDWLKSKELKETSIAYTPFIEGFRTAQSLNDKQFSLDDMKTLMHESIKFSEENQYLSIGGYATKHYNWWNNKIQSLQQTSWNVEVNEKNQITKIYSKEDL